MQDMVILVVDDMRSMRAIVKGVLQDMGYNHLHEAADGTEALSTLRNHAIDLVICDVEMPKMDGTQLLHEVRADNDLKSVPFIMLTAMSQRDRVVEILEQHVFDFVLKPINPKMLEDRVLSFVKSREKAQQTDDSAQEPEEVKEEPKEEVVDEASDSNQKEKQQDDIPDLDI